MPETIYETTNRIRDNDGFIYDIRCELLSQHDTIFAHVTHNSPIDGKRVFVPIQFSWRWATVNSETDYDEVAGWACRLYRDLPTDHLYGSGSTYNPDQATFKRLLTPGIKDNNLVDHSLLQLLHDFYVSNPNIDITRLSIFISLEIDKGQLLERLDYFIAREWIELTAFNTNEWYWGYSISAKAIDKIEEQLQLYSESHSENIQMSLPSKDNQKLSKEVFIVHGHDDSVKQSVARLIEKMGLEVIILHEKPNKGRTIIKKFEDYSNVDFAVILLTPDDVGALATDKENLKNRARQNVILELGFFMGKIGLDKVCALHKGDIELPSDYDGVLYIKIDEQDAWKYKLAKELKAAGYEIDLNDVA